MSFDSYFRVTSYGLIAAAVAAMAVTGQLDIGSIVLYVLAFCWSAYADFRGFNRLRMREWMWRLLTILYIPFVFIDAAYLSSKVVALVHMSLFVSAAKLLQNKRDRDWVFLYLIGFFQILLAASLTFNASFVASLVVYVFFFVSTLAAFEIKRARGEVSAPGEEVVTRASKQGPESKPPRHRPAAGSEISFDGKRGSRSRMRYLFGASLFQLVLVGALTLPLFFLIPRFSGNVVSSNFGDFETVTGFSDTVRLGDLASIKSSSRVVMRVKLDQDPGRYLRWRGVALDHYDGRTWTFSRPSPEREKVINNSQRRGAGGAIDQDGSSLSSFLVDPEDPVGYAPDRFSLSQYGQPGRTARTGVINGDFYLEPLNVGTLFAAGKLLRIRGPFHALRMQDTGAVYTQLHGSRMMYSAWSYVDIPGEDMLREDLPVNYPDKIERYYLQLPDLKRDRIAMDPRVSRLAHDVTRGLNNPYDQAKAVEHYLKTNFGYTLNLRPTSGDPLAEFLFNVREGHCEYFATAMVIMLRTLHIPARIVNGFQMGEFNDINQYYTVRERDAHSWVEAYFPGNDAWIEFDPTPSTGLNDYSAGGLMSRLRKYLDAAEVFWLDYVVTLDRDQQAGLMISLQHRLLDMKQSVLSYYTAAKQWMLGVVTYLFVQRRWRLADIFMLSLGLFLVCTLVVGTSLARSYYKMRGQPSTGYYPWWHRLFVLATWRGAPWIKRDQKRTAILFYEQMLATLARRKLIKSPDQTPLEFAMSQQYAQVREITEMYNNVRFGGGAVGETENRRIARLLAELKAAIRTT
jgi:hypothetical protein